MRIYTRSGDLAFKTFTFPDGQPHFKLETYVKEFDEVTIETAIKTCHDLVMVALASSVLRSFGYQSIQLDIRYLLSARMDRAISWAEPFTLDVVARIINSCGFSRVRILDVHSEVATRLIRNSENLLPHSIVRQVFHTIGSYCIAIAPDKGAAKRVYELANPFSTIVHCLKERNMATGQLSNFVVLDKSMVTGNECLIIDDICDGGNTFVGLSKELQKAGAKKVFLFVSHGIFSKGTALDGIDRIFTTDSYFTGYAADGEQTIGRYPTVIPISMKDLK